MVARSDGDDESILATEQMDNKSSRDKIWSLMILQSVKWLPLVSTTLWRKNLIILS